MHMPTSPFILASAEVRRPKRGDALGYMTFFVISSEDLVISLAKAIELKLSDGTLNLFKFPWRLLT